MNVRTFINLKKDIAKLASNLFPNGSPLYPLTQTGQTEESEELLLRYYTLMKLYEKYFPKKEIRFYEDTITSKEHFRTRCKRAAGILENSKTAFRGNPVYIEVMKHQLTKEEVTEELLAVSAEATTTLPENIIPVVEANHFDVAYFIKDLPNCVLYIKHRSNKSYLKSLLNALDEALIYQLVVLSKDKGDEYIQELSETLEAFKGMTNDVLIDKAQKDLESRIMEISRDLYDTNIQRVVQEINRAQRDIDSYSENLRAAIYLKKDQERLLDDLVKQEGVDYSQALVILSKFDEFRSIETDGKNIIFDVIGDVTFDENLINDRFIKDNAMLVFFRDIIKGDVSLKFASSITVDPVEGFLHYQANRTEDIRRHLHYQGVTQNPHHSGYKCFGSYRDSVKTAISASNWIAVGLLILESACSLNLIDGAVYPNFRDNLKGGSFTFYYKGQQVYFSDYVNIKNQELKGGS